MNYRTKINDIETFPICALIGINGLIYYEIINKEYNGEEFSKFVNNLPKLKQGSKLIMDNVSYHKTAQAQSALLLYNSDIELIYLPEYTTKQLNPIEEYFDIVRKKFYSLVQRKGRVEKIDDGLKNIFDQSIEWKSMKMEIKNGLLNYKKNTFVQL